MDPGIPCSWNRLPAFMAGNRERSNSCPLSHGPWSGSRVVPNPLRTEAQVAFATARDGPLSVGIFDLGGRRVRTLLEEAGAPAGLHVIAFDGRGDDGARLRSGLYFYRIRSADGLRSGRFVIAR